MQQSELNFPCHIEFALYLFLGRRGFLQVLNIDFKIIGHFIKSVGQIFKLIAGLDIYLMIELAIADDLCAFTHG